MSHALSVLWQQTFMDEIVSNLWLGGVLSLARLGLEENVNNIHSILSTMKGSVVVPDTFVHMHIPLDDNENEDMLGHFPRSIAFIQGELDHGRCVLVHCQGGISRSATIVAAYLMYSRDLERDAALTIIRKARRITYPNESFMKQLDIFHRGGCRVSREDEATREFYANRAAKDIIRGDSSLPSVTDTFVGYSNDTLDSVMPPSLPGKPRQRILCRICRQELATREHIVDHGKLSSPAPSFDSLSTKSQPSDENQLTSQSPDNCLLPRWGPHAQSSQGDGCATDADLRRSDLDAPTPPDVQRTRDRYTAISEQVQPTAALDPSGDLSRSNLPAATLHQSALSGPKCSGYFLKTMRWMEFVKQGQVSGTISCPNQKCHAKVGKYNWHGLCCGCGEWVAPGFCISRSEADEAA